MLHRYFIVLNLHKQSIRNDFNSFSFNVGILCIFRFTGTCKIERNCTSTLNVSNLADGKAKVEICYTHYGHTRDIQHTWLPKGKRQELAAKIQQGVPREKILDDIRDSVTENNFFRYHLLEKKDLLNIERAFGLKDFQRHINDQDSVLAWITEWEQSADTNPILFCKFQDEMVEGYDLSKEDFVLIIQSPFQRHML